MKKGIKKLYLMLFISLIVYSLIIIFQIPIGRWGVRTYGLGAGMGLALVLYPFHIVCYIIFIITSVTFIVQIAIRIYKQKHEKIPKMETEVKVKIVAVVYMICCIVFHQLFGIWT